MFIKDLQNCEEFLAGDNTILREFLHPDKVNLNLRYGLTWCMLFRSRWSQKQRTSRYDAKD